MIGKGVWKRTPFFGTFVELCGINRTPFALHMKKLIAAFLLALPLAVAAQIATSTTQAGPSINWMTLEEAVEAQKKNPRKIMMDVYTKWCGPCKMLDKNTFHDADVVAYVNANYYAVKFDAESPDPVTFKGKTYTNPTYNPGATGRNGVHELTRYFQVSAYPTIVFLDEQQEIIAPVKGYKTPGQLEMFLKFFHADSHKNADPQKTWDAYRSSFKPTWD